MLIGNDLVDLNDPQADPGSIHPRFDQRILTDHEHRLVKSASSAHRFRWMLWAAKESAFKVLKKIDAKIAFHPQDFEVSIDSLDRMSVHHNGLVLETLVYSAPRWVHAVTTAGSKFSMSGNRMHSRVFDLQSIETGVDQSAEVRTFTRRTLSAWLGVSWQEVEVVTENRIPRALKKGRALDIDLSLSHDGNFVACAWIEVSQ